MCAEHGDQYDRRRASQCSGGEKGQGTCPRLGTRWARGQWVCATCAGRWEAEGDEGAASSQDPPPPAPFTPLPLQAASEAPGRFFRAFIRRGESDTSATEGGDLAGNYLVFKGKGIAGDPRARADEATIHVPGLALTFLVPLAHLEQVSRGTGPSGQAPEPWKLLGREPAFFHEMPERTWKDLPDGHTALGEPTTWDEVTMIIESEEDD